MKKKYKAFLKGILFGLAISLPAFSLASLIVKISKFYNPYWYLLWWATFYWVLFFKTKKHIDKFFNFFKNPKRLDKK